MPLLDHFHAPLLDDPPWSSLAMMWAAAMVAHLNRLLPRDDFRAYGHVQVIHDDPPLPS